jgi:hypothetical protein
MRGASVDILGQDLDGRVAAEVRVGGAVDLTHAAGAPIAAVTW